MTYIKRSNLIIILTLVLFVSSVILVGASTVVRSGDNVSIAAEQVVEGDLYSAAGKINISGVVEEDAVIVGGQVTVTGTGEIRQDALILAGSVDFHGKVGDDLRIVSGEVTIAESINGDLFVAGGSVAILSSADIAGDVLVYGGSVTIEGAVGGDILGAVSDLRIDSYVGGDIDVAVSKLTLGDRADIQGSVRYTSSQVMIRSLNASVIGDLVRNDPILPDKESKHLTWMIPGLVLLFSVLVWYLMSRPSLNLVIGRALVRSPRPFLLGIATLILAPIAIGLLLVSLVGSLVGVVFMLSYLLFVAVSIVGSMAVLGQFLMVVFNKANTKTTLLSLVVGTLGFVLLSMLPVVGEVILFVFVMLTLGAITDILLRPRIK